MTDLVLVQVLNTCKYLVEEATSISVLKSLLLNDVVKQFSTRSVFHDEKQLSGSFNYFVQLNYVGVSHNLEDVNLPHDSGHIRLVLDLLLLKDLDGDFLLGEYVSA